MFPLMPNTAHFKSQMDVAFIGGASNGGNTNVYTFNAIGNAPEAPRDRVFIVAVARKRSSDNQKLAQLTVNGVQSESIQLFDPGRMHDVYFAIVRHRSLVGPVNVVATFDGTLNSCVVCVWSVDGMPNSSPLELAEQNYQGVFVTSQTDLTLQLETPEGGVSFFAAAMIGNVSRNPTNTDMSYRVAGLEGDQSYVFSLVDNSTGESARVGPQTITIGAGRVAGMSFGGHPKPWTPALLFAEGAQGAWFDPSDLSSMFQDAAGTIPAQFGRPVGMILDKSGNGNHASQAAIEAQPMLLQDDNGFPFLYFDGAGDFMASASAVDGIGGPFRAAIAVRGYNLDGSTSPQAGIEHWQGATNYSRLGGAFYYGSSAIARTQVYRTVTGTDPLYYSTSATANVPPEKLGPHVYVGGYADGELYIQVDTGTRNTSLRDTRPTIAGTFRIGGNTFQSGLYGAIYVIGEGRPEDEENCRQYLAARVGVSNA